MKNFAIAAIAMLGLSAGSAQADLIITLDFNDGAPAPDVVVADGVGAGVAVGGGLVTTHADASGVAGVVLFVGGGGGFVVTVATGSSKPAINNGIDLASVEVSGGAGSVTLGMTDTDFGTSTPTGLTYNVGGTTTGAISFDSAGADTGNAHFTIDSPVVSPGAFGPGAFSATTHGMFGADPSFSLTQYVTVTHSGAGQITSFDAHLTIAPEPGSMALLGLGLATLGMGRVRRRRRN